MGGHLTWKICQKDSWCFVKSIISKFKNISAVKSQFLEVPYLLFEFGESVFQEPVALCPPIQQESQHINHSKPLWKGFIMGT